MRETSPAPLRIDLGHDRVATRRASLASEARRLSRRRTAALAVAARCRKIDSTSIPAEAAQIITTRAMRRATTLHVRFHHTLDALVSAGGFDEALTIVRERRA